MSTTTTTTTTASTHLAGAENLPPFPSDVSTAPIATISYQQLCKGDDETASKVLEACRTEGFFYLDLRDTPDGRALLEDSEKVLEAGKKALSAPLEEKRSFAMAKGKSLMGYKSAGTIKAGDPVERPDTTEFYSVSKDHVHGFAPSRDYPKEFDAANQTLRDFTRRSHECSMQVLSILERKLGLEEGAFTTRNTFTVESEDNLRVTRKTPHDESTNAIGLRSHTDIGTITLLWNWLGGLQIQSVDPAKQGEWEYVKPTPGHAVVNLADAMVKWTNGILKSARHRVVNAPGEQATVDRYSVAYFVRPNNEVLMQPLDGLDSSGLEPVQALFTGEDTGKVYTALEWQQNKQASFNN